MERTPYTYSESRRNGRNGRSASHNGTTEPGIGELFRDLTNHAQRLVHLEVQLAKAEISEKAESYGKNAGLLVGGGMVAYAGFIGIVIGLGLLLGTFMPDWLGLVIAGLVVVLAGAAALQKGLSGIQNTEPSLERTAESIQEDKEWIRGEVSDLKEDPAHLGSHR